MIDCKSVASISLLCLEVESGSFCVQIDFWIEIVIKTSRNVLCYRAFFFDTTRVLYSSTGNLVQLAEGRKLSFHPRRQRLDKVFGMLVPPNFFVRCLSRRANKYRMLPTRSAVVYTWTFPSSHALVEVFISH